MAQVLSSGAADGVHIISLMELAELGVSGLELLPHVNVLSARDVHHTVRVLRAPGVFGVLDTVSHVGREGGNGHQSLTTTHHLQREHCLQLGIFHGKSLQLKK